MTAPSGTGITQHRGSGTVGEGLSFCNAPGTPRPDGGFTPVWLRFAHPGTRRFTGPRPQCTTQGAARAGRQGDRQRVVPLPEMVYTELLAYLQERGGKRGPLLRTAAKGRPLRAKDICGIVRCAAERAGLSPEITPKTLRHSYATHLMDCGVDLAVIARLMGHRSPAETGVYLHVLKDRPRRAVNRLNLPGSEKP